MITIPKTTTYTIKRGSKGIAAFTVQRALNKFGYPTAEDMDFGPATEANVKKLQSRLGLVTDGIVGPNTQGSFAKSLCSKQERVNDLPDHLLYSTISYESGGFFAAVNWSVSGGVDCGMTQRRVYDSQYKDDAAVKRAFDAVYQLNLAGNSVQELSGIFLPRAGVKGSRQMSFRLAVLNHNYPYAADKISRIGVSGLGSYWRTAQSWVTVHKLRFPDGHSISTPLEWCQRYALGNSSHGEPGQSVKLVRNWS